MDTEPGVSQGRSRSRLVVPGAIVAMVVLRIVQFRANGTPDEGGFLMLAGQWHNHGSSLYGDYWVDRPPLLITLFQIPDLFGGILALRIFGTLVAVITVLLVTSTARRVYGDRAALVAAVVMATLLATPLYGADDVNGELLSLPFLALGLRAATEAVLATSTRRARLSALTAGMAAVAALLVKQNIADVVVFAAVFWLCAWRLRQLTFAQLAERVALAAAGAVIAYAVVMGWAIAHGTSPAEVYQATYPFRLKAARVIADTPGVADKSGERLLVLGEAFAATGVPLVALLFVFRGVWRSQQLAFAAAVLAVLGWGTFSVLAGGSYWLHYLVESAPAVALAAAALAVVLPRISTGVVAFMVTSAVVASCVAVADPPPKLEVVVADTLTRVKQPGDTIFVAFGDAEILRVTGMSSPYVYPWSLPARTLDPKLDLLRGILEGPKAPTWVVVRGGATLERLRRGGALQVIERRYREVGDLCGRRVYLRSGQDRQHPVADEPC